MYNQRGNGRGIGKVWLMYNQKGIGTGIGKKGVGKMVSWSNGYDCGL